MKTFVLLFLTSVLTLIKWSSAQTNYCNIQSCTTPFYKGPHTMCLYPTSGPSSNCRNYRSYPMTQEVIDHILKFHNDKRQRVASGQETQGESGPQPAAQYMPKLTWDPELATIAQRLVDQCSYHHDKCRDTNNEQVGQNIGWQGTTGDLPDSNIMPLIDKVMNAWYNEVSMVNKNDVQSFSGSKGIGHYSQIVWADTKTIGCGVSRYHEGKFNKMFLACDYGPAGNIFGRPYYKIK